MLSLAEKKKDWENFKNSDKFGQNTYLTLGMFYLNLKIILTTIRAYDVLVAKLENKIENDMTERQIFRVKEQMLLDIYAKLLSVIESILILCHALSEGYEKVSRYMTFYPVSMLNQSLENCICKKYNMRKILGLPDLGKLDLTTNERQILSSEFNKTYEFAAEILKGWAEFYDQLRIIYGKSRHGFSYLAGIGRSNDLNKIPPLNETWIVAFDKKDKERLPHGTISLDPKDVKKNNPWFNIESWLKIDDKLFRKVGDIINELDQVGTYIIENHLLYADNCGEDYIPSRINGDKVDYCIFLGPETATQEEQKVINEIAHKLAKNLHIANRQFGYGLSLDNPDMNKSMNENMITNFWFGKDESSCPN